MRWDKMKNLILDKGLNDVNYREIFPKGCPVCSLKFTSLNDFFSKTNDISSEVLETDSESPIKIRINCSCRECCHIFDFEIDERRDNSSGGFYVRNKFSKIIDMLIDEGLSRGEARKEILNLFDDLYSKIKDKHHC